MEHVASSTPTAAEESPIVTITLKGGCGTMEVDTSRFDMATYKAIFVAGVESLVMKSGMSKLLPGITKLEGKEQEGRIKEVREQAEKNLEAMYAGNLKGGKAKKAAGAVNVEAMRLAKNMLRDLIKASGQKIGAYSAKEQTAAAKVILDANPHLLKLAEENLANRVEEAKGAKKLDLKGLFGAKAESDEVKAKPKVPPKKKEKADKPISAAQAGKVAPRQKPSGATAH